VITAPLSELTPEAPGSLALRRLANLVARFAPHDGAFPLRLPGTYVVRLSHITTEPTYATMRPAVCIVAQGAKVVMLGRDVVEYDPARVLVFAVDLPMSSQVIRASRKEPYLGFILDLDPARVAELATRVYPKGIPNTRHKGVSERHSEAIRCSGTLCWALNRRHRRGGDTIARPDGSPGGCSSPRTARRR
jgi:hypothetical protein